ncbi:MAG: MBL fold metallo-hydrolase [Deltaproteobacteria bacterium]|nr:MBL fold metallo-hydrolase [Deltaproteobacteria bacterium]
MMKTLTVGPLDVNCYIVWDRESRGAFVIDPGGDAGSIEDVVKKEGLDVRYIINTHGHFDHVGGDAELKKAFCSPLAIHASDAPMLSDAHEHGILYGVKTPRQPEADIFLEDGMELKAGGLILQVIHTPGHTKGGVCLLDRTNGLLFTGDTLFAGSIGRTDFEGGSFDELMGSLRDKILPLADGVKVFPGHGPSSTIGREKASNPFILDLKDRQGI